MFKQAGTARAALLGTLCALVAFTYAIASVPATFDSVDAVGSRGVGTSPLRFTNPLISGDRDLGDVVLGGSFTRFARAAGGLPPYKFSSANISGLVSSILTSGAVDFTGKVSGSVNPAANIAAIGGSIRFNITVTDQNVGTTGTKTETFRLSVDSTGLFKFANGPDLGTAPRFADFSTQIDTINGKGNIVFAATAVSGITGVSALSDVGLFLDSTGKIFGKPYLAGTLSITVTATDSTNAKAAARDGTGSSQVFTLTIEPGVNVTSDVVVTKAQIKYDAVKSAKKASDSVSISGMLNVKGAKISDFNTKKFSVQIGNFKSTEVTLDAKGKTNDKDVKKVANVSVSTKGTFKASYKGLNISSRFPGIADGGSSTLPTGVTLTDSVATVDPLIYSAKGTAPKQTLSYAIGKNISPAGAFLLTSVKGKNNKENNATSFQVAFIGVPGSSAAKAAGTFTGATKAAVSIGNVTDSALTVTEKSGKVKANKLDKAVAKNNNRVTSLSLDAVKGKGSAKTNPFVAGATGTGIAAATDGATGLFPFSVTISTATADLVTGVGSARLFGKKTSYVSVNPAK